MNNSNGFSRRTFLSLAAATGAGFTLEPLMKPIPGFSFSPGNIDEFIPSFCEMCFWKCGIVARKRNGKVDAITGSPNHPLSNGRLCPRGTAGFGTLYDPDRIKTPMIRKGTVWREASWEEALSLTAEKMSHIWEKYSPSSMALFSHGFGASFFNPLFKPSGMISAPSYAQCRGPRDEGFNLTFGDSPGSPEKTDMENSTFLVLIGTHLGENMHNTQVQEFTTALERGAELVVVDPRFSVAAGKAKHWLPIEPGTDLGLVLSWIHLLIEEKSYNKEFVDRNCEGLRELKKEVAPYTPEWAYTQTGIRPEKIREIAHKLGMHSSSALVHPGRRSNWYGNDTQRSRAIAILNALLGNWGQKGGFFQGENIQIPPYPTPPLPKEDQTLANSLKKKYPFASKIPSQVLRDYTLKGGNPPVKGWMVYGTDLLNNIPYKEKTIAAMKALEFLVVIDILPIELTGWADVVLPDTSYLERYDDLHTPSWKHPYVALRQPVVEPLHDSKPSWWIAKNLAKKLGMERYYPWKNVEEYLEKRLSLVGLSLKQMKKEGVVLGKKIVSPTIQPEFYTDSGKIELYSHALAEKGFDPVPKYSPPVRPPEGFFRLLVGRASVHTFGRTTNNKVLGEFFEENEIWINTIVAREFELKAGQYITLINQDGIKSSPIKVKVTERIRPDSVYMVHGFGRQTEKMAYAYRKGAADNDLMSRVVTDPIMGATSLNTNFVTFSMEKTNV